MIKRILIELLGILFIYLSSIHGFYLLKSNYRFSKVLSKGGLYMSLDDRNDEENNAVNDFWQSKINIV